MTELLQPQRTDVLLWLLSLPLASLTCIGMHKITRFKNWSDFDKDPKEGRKQPVKDKMILWFVRYYGSYLPPFFRTPLYECPPCMASIYSLPVYITFVGLDFYYLLFIILVAGINTLIIENLET